MEGEWKIVAKTATREPTRLNGGRVLFVLSSAKFHGASKQPAGVSLGEVVQAWDTFLAAGLTVDLDYATWDGTDYIALSKIGGKWMIVSKSWSGKAKPKP